MTIGIYCIQNIVDGKRYIGKSKHVEKRLSDHRRSLLKPRHKDINRHLYAAVSIYSIDNFTFSILEEHDILNEKYLADRELYFMDEFNTCNREYGYNLRRDSSTHTIVHDETRKIISENNIGILNPNYGNRWTPAMKEAMSLITQERHKSGKYGAEWRNKVGKASSNTWLNVEKKQRMAEKVSEAKSSLRFYEYDKKTNKLLCVWESMSAILKANPDYFRIAIYNVCNGHKKSYRGSVWVSETKRVEEPNDLSRYRNQSETQQDMVMCNKEGSRDKALEK